VASFSLENTNIETGDLITPSNTSMNANFYVWDFGDESPYQSGFGPSHNFEEPGTFTITLVAVNETNCSDQFTQVVKVSEAELIYIPNSFTPNANALNDAFVPTVSAGVDVQSTKMRIFNRQGELLFESYNPNLGWDGTYGGMPCPTGTYVWQFNYRTLDGLEKVIHGHVNLLR
jgi:gliding motility-associated-like protein